MEVQSWHILQILFPLKSMISHPRGHDLCDLWEVDEDYCEGYDTGH